MIHMVMLVWGYGYLRACGVSFGSEVVSKAGLGTLRGGDPHSIARYIVIPC